MQRWILMSLCVLSARTGYAQLPEAPGTAQLCPAPIGGDEGWGLLGRVQGPYLRDTSLGARPHLGPTRDPAHGYDHYDLPSRHYGMWYRPAAFAEDVQPQCQSRVFAPRGFGWANRLDCQQLDYHPYVVKELPSSLGPSYYNRPPLQPCHCSLQCWRHGGALVR